MVHQPPDFTTTVDIDGRSAEAAKAYLELGWTRGITRQSLLSSLLLALLTSGCVAAYSPAPLPATHPANPVAPEAPLPPPSQAFRGESLSPTPTEEAPAHGPHAGHSAMQGMHGGD